MGALNPLFGSLIVWYLFLGGAGSGAYFVSVLLRRYAEKTGARRGSAMMRLADVGALLGVGLVLLGVVFLLADLGRVDRAYTLFTNPTWSAVSVGAYAIFMFSLCAFYLIAIRQLSLPVPPAAVRVVVESASLIFATVIMVYTGVLLAGMQAVALWSSAYVPALFLLSSLSTGIAVVLVAALFIEMPRRDLVMLRVVARIDAALIVAEIVVFVLFAIVMLSSPDAGGAIREMLNGTFAETFWLGYVVLGLVLPVAIELTAIRRYTRSTGVLLGVLILIGGFSLRYLIATAGAHEPVVRALGVLS